MVFNIFKTVCYQDIDDDDTTLSPGCLTSNLWKKNFKCGKLLTVIYKFFGGNSAAKVDVSYCVLKKMLMLFY